MNQATCILLLGSSVMIDGVAHCLENETAINLTRLNDLSNCSKGDFRSSLPDVIIFEQKTLPAEQLIHAMSDYPDTQWIAIDPECSQVSVINNRWFKIKAMKDLVRIIQKHVPDGEKAKGGKWGKPSK